MRTIIIILTAIVLVGCANPINRETAQNYYGAAISAQRNGDWENARMYFGRAIDNANVGGADDSTLAVLWYEYGRSSGVICDWVEAEKGLLKAYELDRINKGPTYMSLYELARMNYDQKDFKKAEGYFHKSYLEFEENQIDTKDPVGYADFLDEYSVTLENLGKEGEAEELKIRSSKIREAFKNKDSHTDKTPYGTKCSNS